MMVFAPVTHVLFDMDGLILDTEKPYTDVFKEVVAKYGKEYTNELKMKVMGTTADDSAKTIVTELNLPLTPDEFWSICDETLVKVLPDTQLMPGVQKLIEHLYKKNIPMGLATSSGSKSYHLKTDKLHQKLFSMLSYKTLSASDPEVKKGKPHPDVFLVAASKFPDKPRPEQCLVFEDAVNGVKAARAAGMQVVMVPDPSVDRSLTKEATLVLNSLEEFKPEWFRLPPYDE